MKLDVQIFKQGSFLHVGELESETVFGLDFTYASAYLSSPDATAISLSLPLREQTFHADETLPFFDGLLPEGALRDEIAREMRVSAADTLQLLRGLGNECIGAVRFLEQSESGQTAMEQPPSGYRRLLPSDLDDMANRGDSTAPQLLQRARLSIAGAQNKIGVYVGSSGDGGGGEYYLPYGDAASTHIMKAGNPRFPFLVLNEHYCMKVANACGLPVAHTEIIHKTESLLLVQRFDRELCDECVVYDGLPSPLRKHQEDFSQALGIDRIMKYEGGEADYFGLAIKLLRTHSLKPIEDIEDMVRTVIINYILGNCDNHLKNHSVLYSSDLRGLSLAPLYDIVCTTAYNLSRELGMRIGSTRNIENITRDDFILMGCSAGLSTKHTLSLLAEVGELAHAALDEHLKPLTETGSIGDQAASILSSIHQAAQDRIKITF
jgi:serine/threonine-protein kinase HipA